MAAPIKSSDASSVESRCWVSCFTSLIHYYYIIIILSYDCYSIVIIVIICQLVRCLVRRELLLGLVLHFPDLVMACIAHVDMAYVVMVYAVMACIATAESRASPP